MKRSSSVVAVIGGVLAVAAILFSLGQWRVKDVRPPTEGPVVQAEPATKGSAPLSKVSPMLPSILEPQETPTTPPVIGLSTLAVRTPDDPPPPPREPKEPMTAGRRRAVPHPSPAPKTRLLTGAVMWIADATQYRINLFLNSNPNVAWGPPYDPVSVSTFRQTIKVDESKKAFPVAIWRHRLGKWTKVHTEWVPAPDKAITEGATMVPVSLTQLGFMSGDLVVVENTPGLLMVADPQNVAFLQAPYLSIISQVSNDPFTLGLTRFPQTQIEY